MTERQCMTVAGRVYDFFNEFDGYEFPEYERRESVHYTAADLMREPERHAETLERAITDALDVNGETVLDYDTAAAALHALESFKRKARRESPGAAV